MTEAEKEGLLAVLPREPDQDFAYMARGTADGELGEDYLIYTSVRITENPDMPDLMENRTRGRRIWAADCTCTCCGESFLTRKVPGMDAIEVYYGDDGSVYTVDPDGDMLFSDVEPAGLDTIQLTEGDALHCPYCGSEVQLMKAKSVKGGRTKAVQAAQLLTIQGYGVILYWLIQRRIDETGMDTVDTVPRDAFVVTREGRLSHFAWGKTDFYGNWHSRGHWRFVKSTRDAWDKLYHDWGSINHKKQGTVLYKRIPSLVGTTGEKTGLYEYWDQGGTYPVEYLRVWRKWRNLENLVKEGLGALVCQLVEEGTGVHDPETVLKRVLDLEKRKPHEMLKLTKEEYRAMDRRHITAHFLRTLDTFRQRGFQGDGAKVLEIYNLDRGKTLEKLEQAMKLTGDVTMDRYLRYLQKQDCRTAEIQLLLDARDFAFRLGNGEPLTPQELWPRRLRAAHDRLSEMLTARENRDKAERYQRGFDQVMKDCAGLQWTDGELCVVLPRCNEDLVREGKVLKHCVGGYGKGHSQGKSLIFFVRRWRKPDRSYYTLNIAMGAEPREIQLHGYGNEYHDNGKGKRGHHRIPRKVREFCDRWEREVLLPYCRERYKEDNKERSA